MYTTILCLAVSAPSVAILRNFDDPEITALQTYLTEMGYVSKVFDQGANEKDISNFGLVIWNDLSYQQGGLTNDDVELFWTLYEKRIPLYFIGDDLAYSSLNLDAKRNAIWSKMTGLDTLSIGDITYETNGQAGNVFISKKYHPILNGKFGLAGDFYYAGDIDFVLTDVGSQFVLANSEFGNALLAIEKPTRVVTQSFLVVNFDSSSLITRKTIFKNAVDWLLNRN